MTALISEKPMRDHDARAICEAAHADAAHDAVAACATARRRRATAISFADAALSRRLMSKRSSGRASMRRAKSPRPRVISPASAETPAYAIIVSRQHDALRIMRADVTSAILHADIA